MKWTVYVAKPPEKPGGRPTWRELKQVEGAPDVEAIFGRHKVARAVSEAGHEITKFGQYSVRCTPLTGDK